MLREFLDYAVPNSVWIDALRTLVIGLNLWIFAWVMMRVGRLTDRSARIRHLMFLTWSVIAALQEVDQLERPMVVWRLPLILLQTVLIIYTMRCSFIPMEDK